jgi:hypothetical protein
MAGFRKPKDMASAERMRALRAYTGYAKAKGELTMWISISHWGMFRIKDSERDELISATRYLRIARLRWPFLFDSGVTW